eukprot:TRINITY_DN2113_c0_g1_i1.p1 TRINITY_DN2113_c0_g1~~TRINITY_DN2113_c0_g1_i1.p1  ORF type:complete len:729 (+),score=110.10 TRINITY_DN2113_c0_g1_i1:1-2187(+)
MKSITCAFFIIGVTLAAFASSCAVPPEWIARSNSGRLAYTTVQPRDVRYYPALGNGYLGQQFEDPYLYMAGVYLGNGLIANGAVRARIPNRIFASPQIGIFASALDLETATFQVIYCDPAAPNISVTSTTYAHRSIRSLWITEMSLSNAANVASTVSVSDRSPTGSPDLNSTLQTAQEYSYMVGNVKKPEVKTVAPSHFAVVSTKVPKSVFLAPGSTQTIYLIAAMRSSIDSSNPLQDAITDFQAAQSAPTKLLPLHMASWAELWRGRVEIAGNPSLALKVNSSLYALYSSIRDDLPWAPSPGGLTPGYSGNVFWDSDLWIMPAILPFHPNLSRVCVDYRVDRIGPAQKRAIAFGFRGAFFPWQSAFSGEEVDWFPVFNYLEQHIGADVAVSAKLQLLASGDAEWMKTRMWPLVSGIADFWCSRVKRNHTRSLQYELDGVVPPDEFAVGFPLYSGVKNSVYTNGAAKEAIRTAIRVAQLLKKPVPAEWTDVAQNLHLPTKDNPPHHPEYDGFPAGNTYFQQYVKQADVVLLQYPIELDEALANNTFRLGDLKFYEPYMSPNGPAMTWSALSLLWLDMGDATLAAKYLAQAEQNILPPFAVWSEVIDPSNPGFDAGILNFITGAGGYIQTIVNGYSGLRYRWGPNGSVMATLKPTLLPQTTSVIWRGIHLAGSSFDISVSGQSVTVALTTQGNVPLQYQISNGPVLPFSTVSPITTSVGTQINLFASPF